VFQRDVAPTIKRYAESFRAVGITGPRQSGKTTLAKILFPHLPYISLENLDIRIQALEDPRRFLSLYPSGAIFDEIQHAPILLSYLQEIIDSSSEKGRFVITGSQHFALTEHINQSLAGRIGMLTLLPLSLSEQGYPSDINLQMFTGGYPGLHQDKLRPQDFYTSYLQTYIERDLRQIKAIENLSRFQTFLKLCAGRIGQIVNFSSLAADCGISHVTAHQWLNILEASYIVFTLSPFHKNFNKRLIKMPKLYFYDTGLACNLLGVENEKQLDSHYLKGGLFENLIILELLKERLNQGLQPNLYFWRDRTGFEIDCIAEWSGKTKAIEIKYTQTFKQDFIKNLKYFQTIVPEVETYLIANLATPGVFGATTLLPINQINQLFT
jgi:predicted AAA+ superfamily ATPase